MNNELKIMCPDCNGSGVYQEYDEYDRYYFHTCSKCNGAGELEANRKVGNDTICILKRF
jgi:DnaJ-class molecular chaperone